MATYTDICNKVKETLVVDYHTRITPQQVNFINPKNSFTGEIHAVGDNSLDGAKLKNTEITQSVLKNSILDNVTFKNGLNIDTVLQTVDGISAKVDGLEVEIDEKTAALNEEDAKLSTAIEFERLNRKNADESLSNDLMQEISFQAEQSKFRDSVLDKKIDEEMSSRISSESELESKLEDRILHDRHFELHQVDTARFPLELKDFAVNTVIDTVPDAYVYESNQTLKPIAKIENTRYADDGTVSAFTLNAFADTPGTFELTGAGKLQYEFSKDQNVQYTGIGGYRLSYDLQASQGLNDMQLVLNSANKNGFYHVNLGDMMVGKVAWNGYDDPKIVDGKLVSCSMTIQSELLPSFSRITPYALQNGVKYDIGNDRTIMLSDNIAILDECRDVRYLQLLQMPVNDGDEPVEFGRIYEGNVFAKDGVLNALVVEYSNKNYTLYKDRNFSELVNKLDPYTSISYIENANRVKVESTRKYYEYKFSLDQGKFIPGYGSSWNKTIDNDYSQARVDLTISSSLLDKYVNKPYILKSGSIANVLECKEEIFDDSSILVGTIELMYFKLQHMLKLRISKLDQTDAVSMSISINDDIAPSTIDQSSVEWYSAKICDSILDIRDGEWSVDHIAGKKYCLDIDLSRVDYRGESKVVHYAAKVEDASGRKVTDCIDVKLPCKHSIPVNPFDVSRHFILNAKFYGKSIHDEKFVTLNIVSNHHEDKFYYAGKPVCKIFMMKDKFSTLEFTEIRPHRFIINDLDSSEIDWRIEWLHNRLSADEISVASEISYLSAASDYISSEISTAILRNRDDVSYIGDVTLSDEYSHDRHNHISDLIATNDYTKEKVQYGFMYRCKAPVGREGERFGIYVDDSSPAVSAMVQDGTYFIVCKKTLDGTIPLNELKFSDVTFIDSYKIDIAEISACAEGAKLSVLQLADDMSRICSDISIDIMQKYEWLSTEVSSAKADIADVCTDVSAKYEWLSGEVSSNDNDIQKLSDDVEFLLSVGHRSMEYFGDMRSIEYQTYQDSDLSDWLIANFNDKPELSGGLKQGFMFRLSAEQKLYYRGAPIDKPYIVFGANDYFTAKHDIRPLAAAKIEDFAIMYDAQAEGQRLCTDLSVKIDKVELSVGEMSAEVGRLCTEISNDIVSKYDDRVKADNYISARVDTLCTEISNDIVSKHTDLTTTISSLCATVTTDFVNRLSANEILGDNTFVGAVSAANVSVSNQTAEYLSAVSAQVTDLTVFGTLVAEDYQTDVIVSHLSAVSADIDNLNAASAHISILTADSTQAGSLSIDSNDLKLVDRDATLNGMLSSIELSTDSISAEVERLCVEISNDIVSKYEQLSAEVSANDDDINYLSSELSNYHNTLSGIDRLSHGYAGHISSDNLIVTDLNAKPEGEHDKYYVTMDYGTLVMRKI